MSTIQVEANTETVTIAAGENVRVFPILGIIPNGQNAESLTVPGSPGIIRIPKTGSYRFSGIVAVDSGDPAGKVRLSLQPEGPGEQRVGIVGNASVLSPVVVFLGAGDLIGFRAFNPGADPVMLQLGPDYNYGLIEYLG